MKTNIYFTLILFCSLSAVSYSQKINKDLLIQDIRQLSNILETSHPDPYIKGGGKIAYNERLQKLMLSIPDSGMATSEFQKILLPFVASVGDGHTRILVSYKKDDSQPGGIPLIFNTIEKSLYVVGVVNPNEEYLIGALLLSVENVPFQDIYSRVTKLRGVDNEYGGLTLLEGKNYLWYKGQLQDLIPEWKNYDSITVKLRLPDGNVKELSLNTNVQINNPIIYAKSKVITPSTKKCEFEYDFLDKQKKTAILKIDGMGGFRENFELVGLESEFQLNGARYFYKRYNGTEAPEDKAAIIQGIPSATEKFKSMVEEMKKAKTEILIIDLRENGGGNSTLGQFLVYFLYGKDALIKHLSSQSGYEIKKFSSLYFEENKNESLAKINENSPIPLLINDYWFEDLYKNDGKSPSEIYSEIDAFYKKIPTFYSEYHSNLHSKYYCPPKVFVLCSPQTYSSGFTMMKTLHEMGATLIGTPSSQAGNNPGWILNYTLNNTGLKGWVACKYYVSFSDRFKNGVYIPDYLFTYDELSKYNFDPNAEILYILETMDK